MRFTKTTLKDAHILEIQQHKDHRGSFGRFWCTREFEENGLSPTVVQANTGFSRKRGTIRGLHYQVSPFEEAKTIRCVRGKIFDVIIDLRPGSPTYRNWEGFELSDSDNRMLYVPGGFAHGYQTLENDTEIIYLVSEFYNPDAEKGVRFDDPAFGIKWPITDSLTISEKDKYLPDFSDGDDIS